MRLHRSLVPTVLVAVAALATTAAPVAAAPTTPGDVVVKVMTMNIFYGGDEINLKTNDWCTRRVGCRPTLNQVVRTIKASGATVVGLEEAEHNTVRIAEQLGWYASERTGVISKYPLLDPPGSDGTAVLVEVAPGAAMAMVNLHLPSDPYGPYLVRDGGTEAELDALERSVRLPAVEARLPVVRDLLRRDVPTFVVGDFNSPSHLDWTTAVAAVRPEVPFAYEWPASKAFADAGLRDTYREAHPDPVATPGFTWTPGGLESDPREVHDRIDLVLAGGPVETRRSDIVGEAGGPDVTIGMNPYPSDHRGVVSTVVVTPAPLPPLVSAPDRSIVVGDQPRFDWSAPATPDRRLALLDASGRVLTSRAIPDGPTRGSMQLRTSGITSLGASRATVLDRDRNVVAATPVWLYGAGTMPSLAAEQSSYAKGEPITIHFADAPGYRFDWVAIYRVGHVDPPTPGDPCNAGPCGGARQYLMWRYTGTEVDGSVTIDATANTGRKSWPLPPGTYEARLNVDDSYWSVAVSAPFTIG